MIMKESKGLDTKKKKIISEITMVSLIAKSLIEQSI